MEANMLSRVADGIYWLNRYMERTDGMILTLSTLYNMSFDQEANDLQGYKPLLEYYTDLSPKKIIEVQYNTDFVLKYMITDLSNPNSAKSLITKARENARGAQDKITKELWGHINVMYLSINSPNINQQLESSEAGMVLTKIHNAFLMYSGIFQITMPRGLAWGFSNAGKNIERCLQTLTLSQTYYKHISYDLEGKQDLLYWRKLLLSLSGYELYMKSYSNIPDNRKVAQQVIFNKDFARSVAYTLGIIDASLKILFRDTNLKEARTMKNQFGRLKSSIEYVDYHHLTNQELETILENTIKQLTAFSGDFSRLFFSYN